MHGWMISNPGKPVTIYDVAGLIGKAYNKAFTKENIEKGFEVSGIFPYNRNIFKNEEFLSSYVTDRLLPENENEADINKIITNEIDKTDDSTTPMPSNSNLVPLNDENLNQPSTLSLIHI